MKKKSNFHPITVILHRLIEHDVDAKGTTNWPAVQRLFFVTIPKWLLIAAAVYAIGVATDGMFAYGLVIIAAAVCGFATLAFMGWVACHLIKKAVSNE